jgi:hypothetical protein
MNEYADAPRAWAHLTRILWDIKQASELESTGNGLTSDLEGDSALYRPAKAFSSPAKGFDAAFRTGFKSQVSLQECANDEHCATCPNVYCS